MYTGMKGFENRLWGYSDYSVLLYCLEGIAMTSHRSSETTPRGLAQITAWDRAVKFYHLGLGAVGFCLTGS